MVRVLVPSGALGLDYDRAALARGVGMKPDIIAIDGGSTDSGPSYLGRGVSKYSRASTKLEWREILAAGRAAGCPVVIGTAGTCGAGSAVDWLVEITREIAAEEGWTAKLAVLKSDQPAERAKAALAGGHVRPLTVAPEISDEVLDGCTNIVALAGAEQVNAALETGADIVICGRTTDAGIIAALPLARGCHAGASWHGAKIGECGALCSATDPQSGVILIDFDADGFTVTPLAEGARATPDSVLAHMLYENSDPFVLYEPGGHLDVTRAEYVAVDGVSVRVIGSEWHPEPAYTVKLEGARVAGHQVMILALLRDPRYVANADAWCADVVKKASAKVADRLGIEDFTIELRQIGKNATLGALESRQGDPVELGILCIATAPTPEAAEEIGKILNPYLLHHPLTKEEEVPTFAFAFSPADIRVGPLYEFCLNHVMELDDPMAAFSLEVVRL